MTYKNDDIEKLFREGLGEYKAQPSDKVWDNIVTTKKNSSGTNLSWGSIFGLTALLISCAAYFLNEEYKVAYIAPKQSISVKEHRISTAEIERTNTPLSVEYIRTNRPSTAKPKRTETTSTTNAASAVKTEFISEKIVKSTTNSNKKPTAPLLSQEKLTQTSANPIKQQLILSQQEGCVPLEVSFSHQGLASDKILWKLSDGAKSYKNTFVHTFTKPGQYIVELFNFLNGKTELVSSDTVTVYESPVADCELTITDMTQNSPVYFYNYSTQATAFEWKFNDSIVSTEQEPVKTVADIEDAVVKLTVWSEHNCADSILAKNPIEDTGDYKILFPNAFVPNEMGPTGGHYSKNIRTREIFYPIYAGVKSYHLQIFSRTGAKVFESHDINVGWDGYYRQKIVQQDAYIWKARGTYFNGKTFVKRGDVIVLRNAK